MTPTNSWPRTRGALARGWVAAIDANVRAADTAVVDADQGLALLGNGLFHFTDSHLFRAFIDESFTMSFLLLLFQYTEQCFVNIF